MHVMHRHHMRMGMRHMDAGIKHRDAFDLVKRLHALCQTARNGLCALQILRQILEPNVMRFGDHQHMTRADGM